MFQLRPYQVECSDNVVSDLVHHKQVGAILPTGAGKTTIFIDIAAKFVQTTQCKKKVLVLSHLSLLTTQSRDRFKKQAPHLKVDVMQADKRANDDAHVVVSTMQSSRDWKKVKNIKDVGLIIIDEAHHIMTQSYQQILNFFPNVKVLGVTATPFRDAQLMTQYFDKISFTISLQELIDQGYLVPPKLHQIKYEIGDLTERMAMVIKLYKEYHLKEKAIVYMKTIDDAKLMRQALDQEGVNARSITSELTSATYRDELLNDFSTGNIDILTTVNVLTAGVDLPPATVGFMPYATKSPTMFMQRVGRFLRPFTNKTHADIYCFGNAPSIKKGDFNTLLDLVLTKGERRKPDTVTEMVEHLDFLGDNNSESYLWNQEVLDTIKDMQSKDMTHFANLLDHKNFPPKFLKAIGQIKDNLPQYATPKHLKGSVTDRQKELLTKQGFEGDQLEGLTKGEASQMIATLYNKDESYNRFVLKSGKHKGRHLSQVPPMYFRFVLGNKHMKNSGVGKLIQEWLKVKRAYENRR